MSAGIVGMIMSMVVVVLMLVLMTVIVAVTMRVMAMVVMVIMMMIVPTVWAMDMALGGLFFGQEGGAAFTDIGIGFGCELVHAGQDAKAHGF
jgi:hypothetical protein